jgi:putative copper export protein/mono/diheme cytochrome c family protein
LADLLIVARAVHFAGTALTAGLVFFLLYVGGPAPPAPEGVASSVLRLRARVLRMAWIALGAAMVAGAVWVLAQAAEIGDVPLAEAVSRGVVWTVLRATHFGLVADIRLGIAACLCASLTFALNSRSACRIASACAAALLGTIAWTGHAAGTPGLIGAVHLGADALHLIAAGAWIGGLPALGLTFDTACFEDNPVWRQTVRTATSRFSLLGIASVGTLLATGSINTWVLAGSVPTLIGTAYGQLLLVKIALFVAMVSLAAINRLRLTPLLSSADAHMRRVGLRTLARNALAEFVLGLAIFAAVGVLGTLPPGLHVQPEWPLPYRLNLDLLADPTIGVRAQVAALAIAVGLALSIFGLAKPKRGWPFVIAGLLLATTLAPPLGALFECAYPTSFDTSPTGYSTDSIALGRQLFQDYCVACHGTTGRGDGPAAARAARNPADLTAEHIYAHTDGDLFWWIGNGIDGAMPAFGDMLDETARWNLIDFIHANADGVQLRFTPGRVGSTGYPTPAISITCGGMDRTIESLRGGIIHVIFLQEADAGPKHLLERDHSLGVTAIIASRVGGDDPNACLTDETSLLDTMAVYRGLDVARLDRTEWLIDGSGLLRSIWYPQAGRGPDWSDDQVFARAVQELSLRPGFPKRVTGHVHH